MPKAKFRDISRATDEQKADAKAYVEQEIARLHLTDLRRARMLSQEDMAEHLQINQGAVSRLEHQSDMYVRTLRRFVEAAGGRLSLTVSFPDSDAIELVGIGDLAAQPGRALTEMGAPSPRATEQRQALGSALGSRR